MAVKLKKETYLFYICVYIYTYIFAVHFHMFSVSLHRCITLLMPSACPPSLEFCYSIRLEIGQHILVLCDLEKQILQILLIFHYSQTFQYCLISKVIKVFFKNVLYATRNLLTQVHCYVIFVNHKIYMDESNLYPKKCNFYI